MLVILLNRVHNEGFLEEHLLLTEQTDETQRNLVNMLRAAQSLHCIY